MTTRIVLCVIAASFCTGTLRSEEPTKAIQDELKLLEGEWRIVATEQGGEKVEASGDLVVFSGQKCTVTNPGTKIVFENTITIDPSKAPKWIDVTNTKTRRTWKGIYELKGDTMTAVFQGDEKGERPTEQKTRKGSQEVKYTYERVKPK